MKRLVLRSVVLLLVLVWMAVPAFAAKEAKATPIKGKEVSLTGTVTCTFCKLSNPKIACAAGCCEACIKSGDPPLLTDTKGNQYILLSGERGVPLMTPERYKMLGGKVNVKGILVKGKGIQVIYVDHMEAK
jgi:hypothetical protein